MAKASLVFVAVLGLAVVSFASRTFPFDSCNTGVSSIQYVGAAANNTVGCVWAGSDINSDWFGQCVRTWSVAVTKCNVTFAPSLDETEEGCPCWWFGLSFQGTLKADTLAELKQTAPLKKTDDSIKRIKWAADNIEAYKRCFLKSAFLSDVEDDIVKTDRVSSVLSALGDQLHDIGILPFVHPGNGSMADADEGTFKIARSDENIYFGDSQCTFKFVITSNDILLQPNN